MDSTKSSTTKPLYYLTQIVWYVLGLLEALLLFRFFLKLLAANPNAGFSSFIYKSSYIFVAPFLSVFRISTVDQNVFEWTTLLAIMVYAVLAMGIVKLLLMSKSISTPEAEDKLNRQD